MTYQSLPLKLDQRTFKFIKIKAYAMGNAYYMKCVVCGQHIPKQDRKEHFGSGQHNLDPNFTAWIIEFGDRLSKLEKQESTDNLL